MNKKIVAGIMAALILTGCADKNGINNNSNEKVNVSKTDKVNDDGTNGTPKDSDGTAEPTESKEDTETKEEAETKVETPESEEIVISINDSEHRVNLQEIFTEEVGTTYRYRGPIDYERIEKLKYAGAERYKSGIFYGFSGFDDSDMKDGTKTFYNYEYNVDSNGITLLRDGVSVPLLKVDKAQKKETWTGDFFTNEWKKTRADFRALTWDEDKIQIEVTQLDAKERTVYTFFKGEGLKEKVVYYRMENDDEYAFPIEGKKLDEQERKAVHQVHVWPNIGIELIEEIPDVMGYYDLTDEYYEILKEKLEKNIEESDILQRTFYSMPLESIKGIQYLWDMVVRVYDKTEDPYVLARGLEEYQRRIEAMNKMNHENGTLFSLRYNATNMYRDNFIGLIRGNSKDKFKPTKEFIDNLYEDRYPEGIRWYMSFKKDVYSGISKEYDNGVYSEILYALWFMEEQVWKGDERFETYSKEMFKALINPQFKGGRVSSMYMRNLDRYLEDKYSLNKQVVQKIQGLILSSNRLYTKELNDYLLELGCEIEPDMVEKQRIIYKGGDHERELYKRLDENRDELQELEEHSESKVWTENDFITSVRDNAIIRVMGEITFKKGIKIDGIKNLSIIGDGDYPVKVTADTYNDVLTIKESENIIIRNLSLGHKGGECVGAVIKGEGSSDITLENSILYGCGTMGLQYRDMKNISVRNTLIWDCSEIGFRFDNIHGVYLNNLFITENRDNSGVMDECMNIREHNIVTGDFQEESERAFIGEWIIKDVAFSNAVTAYGNDEIKELKGKRVKLTEDRAVSFGDSLLEFGKEIKDPKYVVKNVTKDEYFDGWKISEKDIEWLPDRMMSVYVNGEGTSGLSLLVLNEDYVLLYGGGCFFKLERI